MSNIAVFPGSFDPFTIGHESIVRRALPMFDHIVIMIGYNSDKRTFFPLEKKVEWIKKVFCDTPKVSVETHEGLTVDFCRKVKSNHILRGLRTAADFEYERAIAQVNKKMEDHLETVFLLTTPEHTPVTSTIVRDILRHNGDISMFLPSNITMQDLASYVEKNH
ncbi:pantetheine-phosphate adenylyltransferase [Halosquirtibacter laminarini]|uniref:Pantetheine-phosphate adenylyltransferase n=1 Tax=Halosquirtibacter laminarini TaxID=3374600 RepID=A0AC61NFX0_9BACT|nr:pantetheine-phosphate adenylyltransferase [Prolixibacteraceae bacterium]